MWSAFVCLKTIETFLTIRLFVFVSAPLSDAWCRWAGEVTRFDLINAQKSIKSMKLMKTKSVARVRMTDEFIWMKNLLQSNCCTKLPAMIDSLVFDVFFTKVGRLVWNRSKSRRRFSVAKKERRGFRENKTNRLMTKEGETAVTEWLKLTINQQTWWWAQWRELKVCQENMPFFDIFKEKVQKKIKAFFAV